MTTPTAAELRSILVEELRRDLVGPCEPDEQINDRPTVQYLTGILYPAGVPLNESEDEQLSIGGSEEENEPENPIATGQTMNPASIGITFVVEESVDTISVIATYGLYTPIETTSGRPIAWQRQPVRELYSIDIRFPGQGNRLLAGDAQLEWIVRGGLGPRSITLVLVNRNTFTAEQMPDDSKCIFQPHIEVRAADNSNHFVHRVPAGALPVDSDIESYQLLYRECHEFAVGHGCAATWSEIEGNKAGVIATALIPDYQLAMTTPGTMPGLEMKTLAEATDPAEIQNVLQPLLEAYQEWIDAERNRIPSLDSNLQGTATLHMERCTIALNRMHTGLNLIHRDQQVFEAFCFANAAMLLQRSYGAWANDYRETGKRSLSPHMTGDWRPFQIAFILLNIPGISEPEHTERDMVDLLWFPTGGGKTEAYLGLTAFTIGLRRLRGPISDRRGDGGVTVIMRYTLRLLTTQQFQRATTLICACEYMRRKKPMRWGHEPISIGLWVGAGATPNTTLGQDGAEEALDILTRGGKPKKGNPMQLPDCPWCGEKLGVSSYRVDRERERMVISCPRSGCDFHSPSGKPDQSIPALVIDSDIYRFCPTLLLATADKFARLPWKPETVALFGRVDRFCPRHGYIVPSEDHSAHYVKGQSKITPQPCQIFLPPELIIQDELHLISGPLGTLTGLYETAIDILCMRAGTGNHIIRPKIIASTATIRRASDQVRGLFARGVELFPPAGLDSGNSFFALAHPIDQQPGRQYLGIFAPGRSVKTALVRVYAVLLQIGGVLFEQYGPEVADAYFTLVGYFNSVRELGGALRLVEDDIIQRMNFLVSQKGMELRNISTEDCELTSRIDSTKIPEMLKRLEQCGGLPGAFDVLLATNMISVGVDVPRLGLMVVNGQPKASAEYIQATSRVGRRLDAPGLVVTVYNWSRPRDISHYEHFIPYHEAIYRHVEATSVTPFAPRARDRALHAVIIALARLLREQWSRNDQASQFDGQHRLAGFIREQILNRVRQVSPGLVDEIEQQINMIFDWWRQMSVKHGPDLRYQGNQFKRSDSTPTLMHPAEQEKYGGSRPTLNSLREVEGESQIYVLISKD